MKPDVINVLSKNKESIRFLLDSGAFTAWKAGKPISLDSYCSFIESLPFKPWRYFNLDVIGNGEASFNSYETMLSRGFTPVPIFTRGEDIKMIDEYYKTSDVIGIGGLVGTKGNKGFVKGIMKIIGDRKCHWLGFNAKEFIAHYKPYTCDSSSWSSSFRYASACAYKGNGEFIRFTKKDLIHKPKLELLDLIRKHGVDPNELAKNSEWSNGNKAKEYAIETLTHRTWVKYQQELELKLKSMFFLACSTEGQVRLMMRAYNYWSE